MAFVELAADLGFQHISTGLTSFDFGVHPYPPFSLRDDIPLRREMLAAMRDRGVSVSLGEGFTVRPGSRAADFAGDLDLMAELGAETINTVSMDSDLVRTFDEFAALAELAGARGLQTTVELAPSLAVGDLATALAAVHHVGRPDFRLLIDTMHVIRSGATVAEVAAVLPRDRVYSLELPLRSEALAGVGPHERLGKCVTAAHGAPPVGAPGGRA